jgi:hypothetical protein
LSLQIADSNPQIIKILKKKNDFFFSGVAAIGLSFIAVGIHSGTILLFEVGTQTEIEKN